MINMFVGTEPVCLKTFDIKLPEIFTMRGDE